MEYEIVTSRAQMPSSCWGAKNYVKVGLIAYDFNKGFTRQIRNTSSQSVIASRDRLFDGVTNNCMAGRYTKELQELRGKLERVQVMSWLATKSGMVLAQDYQTILR